MSKRSNSLRSRLASLKGGHLRKYRRHWLEPLEDRRMLAVSSPPNQLLELSDESIFLGSGYFDAGLTAGLVSVSRFGFIDIAQSGDNHWLSTQTLTPGSGPVPSAPILGAVTALLNGDPFNDLVIQASNQIVVLNSDGAAGWQHAQTLNYTGVLNADTHPNSQPSLGYVGNDLFLDLIVPLPQSDQIAVFPGVGGSRFDTPTYFESGGLEPTSLTVADLMGGSGEDIVVGHSDGTLTFFEGASDGTLIARSDLAAATTLGRIASLESWDIDGDGRLEIIILGEQDAAILDFVSASQVAVPIANGSFSSGLSSWNVETIGYQAGASAGIVHANSGFAEFTENDAFLTSLSQEITIPQNPHTIEFDVLSLGLDNAWMEFLPDAFEVSLLNMDSESLVSTHRQDSTAFINFAGVSSVSQASGVTWDGQHVTLNISEIPAGTIARLVFDLIGNANSENSSATIDNVTMSPQTADVDEYRLVPLLGPLKSAADMAVGDVDGDGALDIIVSDPEQSAMIVFNGDGLGGFVGEALEIGSFGVPSLVTLGPLTSPDFDFDIAVGLQGQRKVLTPLVSHAAVPTVQLTSPSAGATLVLNTSESAVGVIGNIVLQFSEPMFAPHTEALGSANNPRSYLLYHYGANGVDEHGLSDDLVFEIAAVTYDPGSYRATLVPLPASLADPTVAAGAQYRVVALGADPTTGLRDLAGNYLAGGQDTGYAFGLRRTPNLFVPNAQTITEGEELLLTAILTHNSFGRSYSASIDWGDVATSYLAGQGTFPTEEFAAAHTYTESGIYEAIVTITDDQDGSTSEESQVVTVRKANTGEGIWLPTIDFEADAAGNRLYPGQIVSEQWADWGVHIRTHKSAKYPPMIFDSMFPSSATRDLGSPNKDFGGPGTGRGGGEGSVAANTESLGKVLIISQNGDENNPKDREAGGTLIFDFDQAVMVDDIRVLDIDYGETVQFRWFGVDGQLISEAKLNGVKGGNGHQVAKLDARSVHRLEIEFSGGGAVTDLIFCRDLVSQDPIRIAGPTAVSEGSTYTLTLDATGHAIDQWTIYWGDGSLETIMGDPSTASHDYADGPAATRIRATARNQNGIYAAGALDVDIENVIPILVINGNATVEAGQAFVLELSSTDVGRDTIESWLIDWGDDSKWQHVSGNPEQVSHSYREEGTFLVRAHARDEDFEQASTAPPGSTPFDTEWVSNAIVVTVTPSTQSWLPTIDFEYTGDGRAVHSGDRVTDQFSTLGVAISTRNPDHPAMIFDSSNPTKKHRDLGSPNTRFGGPGYGSGGGPGAGANDRSLNQVLIISEDMDAADSGDKATGGTIVFEFEAPMMMDEVHLLDIETSGTHIQLYAADGSLIRDAYASNLGKNSFQRVELNAVDVVKMEIILDGGGAVAAIVSCRDAPPIQPAPTRFFVVDSDEKIYRYGRSGGSLGDFDATQRITPKGAATAGSGNPLWIVSGEGSSVHVVVFDTSGETVTGAWTPKRLSSPQGIATDGKDIWIVDDRSNRVQRYEGGAARRSGTQEPTDYFRLVYGNQNPKGITTDGTYLWVVDSGSEKVFVYDLVGNWINWWELDRDNSEPTGITVNPGSDGVWVVDANDDKVYVYAHQVMNFQCLQPAASSFALAPGNSDPQGIADPSSPIVIGDTVNASLAAGEGMDWTFNATVGQPVFVAFQSLTGTTLFSYPTTTLWAPSGATVYTKSGRQASNHDSGVQILAESGTYSLQMTTPVDIDFQFTLYDVPPPEVRSLSFGQVYSGAIETPGVEDHWTFTSHAGASIFLDVQTLNTVVGGDLIATILDPDGAALSSRTSVLAAGLDQQVLIPSDGTYTIVFKAAYNGSHTPSYTFQVNEIPPDDVTFIGYRELAQGAIEVAGARDRWIFNATAGDNIFIDFLDVAGGDLQVTLTSPSGSVLYANAFSQEYGFDSEFILTETGDHVLTAQAASQQSSLPTYAFKIWDIPPLIPEIGLLNSPLSGDLAPGEQRIFLIEMSDVTELLIDGMETSGGSLSIQLEAPDGTLVTDRIAADRLLSLTKSGVYRATVQRIADDVLTLDAQGPFAFRLQDVTPRNGALDSLGTRFYLAFPRNLRELLSADVPELSVSVTASVDTSGAVLIPGLNWFTTFDVSAGQAATISLPADVELFDNDSVQDRGIVVTAVDEVAVYGLNQMNRSTDGYTALPLDALGQQHWVLAYPNTVRLIAEGGSHLAIVGTQDNTLVTITPSIDIGSHAAGLPFTLLLHQAQAYLLYASAASAANLLDLSGTAISSTAPVAVFGGNTAAYVPAGFGAADHLVEQLPPLDAWGTRFLTAPLATRNGGDTLRVLAASDDTQIRIDDLVVATLDAGEVYETLIAGPSLMVTSRPALAAQYSNGSTFDGVTSDPFMMLVPPFEQYQNQYTLTTPSAGIDANYANLIVPNTALDSVRIDGSMVPATDFAPIGSTGFSAAALSIGIGPHHFDASGPFGVSIYGFDEFDSYGYFGGMSLAPVANVSSLRMEPSTSMIAINTQHTVTAVVEDATGNGLPGVRVDFVLSGINPARYFAFSDATGRAVFQYSSSLEGTDTITASAAGSTAEGMVQWLSTPPVIEISSPSPAEQLSVGAFVLHGTASSQVIGGRMVEVRVNGKPVDALDHRGNFFAMIDVQAGIQSATVEVVDSFGYQASRSVAFEGLAAVPFPAGFVDIRDVTAATSLSFSRATYHRQRNQLSVDLSIVNRASSHLDPSIAARLDRIDSPTVSLANADSSDSIGRPLVLFDDEVPASGLGPGMSTSSKRLTFDNPQQARFTPEFSILTVDHRPPQFTSAPVLEAVVGKDYRYAVKAIDSIGQSLEYKLGVAPYGMTINSQSGELSWTVRAEDIGTHSISIEVADGRGGTAFQTFVLSVLDAPSNRPPVITSIPLTALTPGDDYRYQVTARDADFDPLSFSLLSYPSGMSIDASSGFVNFDNVMTGTYFISLNVSDQRGGMATQEFTLSVGSNPGIVAPIITSTPIVTAELDSLYVYAIAVEDTTQTALSYSLLESPDGMHIDSTNGRVTWQPTASNAGSFLVRVQVGNELGGMTAQSYHLETISQRANLAPYFESVANSVATIGESYGYRAVAKDDPDQAITYALEAAPDGMRIDASTGQVAWTPALADIGSHRVLISAVDPLGAKAYQQFYLSVRNVNSAPSFTSAPIFRIRAGDAYRYNAHAIDSEDAVTYELLTAPNSAGGMKIDPQGGSITWQPGLLEIGDHPVVVRATDDRGLSVDQSFTLTVEPDTEAPRVEMMLSRSEVLPGDTVFISVQASDNIGVTGLTLFAGEEAIALDNRQASFTASSSGFVFLTAHAEDASGNRTTARSVLRVGDVTDTSPPVVRIENPGDFTTVTYLTDVLATVTDENLAGYSLEYSRLNDNTWRTLRKVSVADGVSIEVVNERIGVLDPTLLPNDEYELKLTAEDLNGNTATDRVILSVQGEAKLGNYRLSFTDMNLPLAGIPIQIVRTYDTLDASESSDFGFGWRLSVASPRIRETTPVSEAEAAGSGMFGAYRLSIGSRVYLNSPEGRRIGFTFQPVPQPGLLGTIWHPRFEPDAGVYERLEVEDTPLSQASDGTFGIYLSGLSYNPDTYTLVSKDQIRFTYHQFSGLKRVTDRNGVQLDYRSDGIFSSTGHSILWHRDELGRITEILGPAGIALHYEYDASGNLIRFTDQESNAWVMEYSAHHSHFLDSVIAPSGRLASQVQYDDQGRFIGVADELGPAFGQTYDLADHRFVETDALGNSTYFVFDDLGNITQQTDALGNTTTATFDDPRNPNLETSITDARGVRQEITYDGLGNVTRIVEYDRTTTIQYNERNDMVRIDGPHPLIPEPGFVPSHVTMSYDANGNLASFTNANGKTETLVSDSLGRVTSIIDANSNLTQFEYGEFKDPDRIRYADGSQRIVQRNAMGRITTATNEVGQAVGFSYDALGRPLTITDASGGTYRNIYDDDLLVQTVDPLGREIHFSYDERKRLVKLTDPLGGEIVRQYDANNRVLSLTDQRGNTEYWSYTVHGQVASYTDQQGRTTLYTYDGVGNLTGIQDPRGSFTGFLYDEHHRLTAVVDALGNTESYRYDERDNLRAIMDRNGGTTNFLYDPTGQLIESMDALGNRQQWTYDAQGNRLSFVDERGNTTHFEYDNRDRLIQQIDASGFVQRWQYDSANRLTRYTDQDDRSWEYRYDNHNQVVSISDPLNGLRRFEYDAVGNPLATTDELGRRSEREYDLLDRVIAEMDASGEFTDYRYDAVGNLLSLTDRLGNTTNYEYNAANELIRRTDPLGHSESFHYDESGNLIQSVDRQGRIRDFTYDRLNRLTSEVWRAADGTELQTCSYAFDSNGNLISATSPESVYAFTYDLLNRVTSVDNSGTLGLPRVVLEYSYDAIGNRIRAVDSFGVSVDSAFDDRNWLSSVSWSGGGIDPARTDIDRDARGQVRLISRYRDLTASTLVSETYSTFDALGNVTRITHSTSAGSAVADYQFTFDAASQMVQQVVNGHISDYSFDVLGQLTVATHTNRADEVFEYDASGNRVDADNRIGPNNQLLSDGTYSYTYDRDGNLSRKQELASGEYTDYEFDHRNRLIAALRYSGSGSLLSGSYFTYDVFDRMIVRRWDRDGAGPEPVETLGTVYDGENAWADFDADGHVVARYLFGQGLDSNIARWRTDEGTAWYLTDHLGSVRDIIDSQGNTLDHIEYDSFGKILDESNPQAGDRFGYTGREWIPELGMYYYRARFYDPANGRFISEDPIGFAANDTNLYRYVHNQPLTSIDPTGNVSIAYGTVAEYDLRIANSINTATLSYACGFLDAFFAGSSNPELQGATEAAIGAAVGYALASAAEVRKAALFGSIGLTLSFVQDIAAGKISTERIVLNAACFVASGALGPRLTVGRKNGQPISGTTNPNSDALVGPTIGRSGFLTSEELADAVLRNYQRYVDDAFETIDRKIQAGLLTAPDGIHLNTFVGKQVDSIARIRLRKWLQRAGISEGPRGLVQVNRWLVDPSGSGSYRIPDVRIPSAGLILDATIGTKGINTVQIAAFVQFSGGNRVTIVRPTRFNGPFSIVLRDR